MREGFRQRQFFILVVDVLLMYATLVLALVIRRVALPTSESLLTHFRHFSFLFLGWVVVFYTLGLYKLERPFDDAAFARKTLSGILVSGLGSALYFYVSPGAGIEPKSVLAIFAGLYAVIFWIWRYSYGRRKRSIGQRIGVGFIGLQPEALDLMRELRTASPLGYDARFAYGQAESTLPPGVRNVTDPRGIRAAAVETGSDLIVIAEQTSLPEDVTRELFCLLDRRTRFMRLPDFYELILRRVPIGAINEMWFLENIDLRAKLPYETGKRVIDILVALTLLVLSLPFWPLIALAIRAESSGPVFFRQTRLGRSDKPFSMIKFRTMKTDGNDQAPTVKDDARITRVGRVLRATRMDELPQVLNILTGDMSFVGPRPERPELAAELEKAIPYYRQRHLVKPGVTGWDQVSGEYHSPSVADTMKKLQYDFYYLKNMSLYFDVSITFKTIMTVLQRQGR